MVAYDFCLAQFSLVNYIFFAPRTDFMSGNREGIYTVVGYVALQLIGTAFGRLVLAAGVEPSHREKLVNNELIHDKESDEAPE